MGEISLKCFDYSMDYLFSKDIRMATKAKNTEDTLDSLE